MWMRRLRGAILSTKFWPICAAAVVLPRLLLILGVPVEPMSDFQWYFNRASELAAGGVYQEGGVPTAFWPVGYPLFLAALFAITGPSLLVAQLANVALAAVAVWLTYKIAVALFNDEFGARLSVCLVVLYPNFIAYSALVASEPLYTALVLAACYCVLQPVRWPYLLIGGASIGVATLVKSQTAMLAAVLVLCAVAWEKDTQARWRRLFAGALMAVVALAIVLPWTIRNYVTFGTPVFVSTNGGISMLMANNPSMAGLWGKDFAAEDPLVAEARFSASDQIAADRRARDLAFNWIKNNPGQFAALMPQKLFRLWAPDGEAEWSFQAGTPWYAERAVWFRAVRGANQLFYAAVLILAAVALVTMLRRGMPGRVYIGYWVALFFTVLCLVFSGQSRYHFPVMPLLMIYVGWWLQQRWLWDRSTGAVGSS